MGLLLSAAKKGKNKDIVFHKKSPQSITCPNKHCDQNFEGQLFRALTTEDRDW